MFSNFGMETCMRYTSITTSNWCYHCMAVFVGGGCWHVLDNENTITKFKYKIKY
jgi:hypothetical protein